VTPIHANGANRAIPAARSPLRSAAQELLDYRVAVRIFSIILCGCMCVSIAGAAGADADAGGVSVMTACDSSPEQLNSQARKTHGRIARRAATETLYRSGIVARRAGTAPRQLDVSVTRWSVASAGGHIDVTAELRVVLCDNMGKMLVIVNGKATASGPNAQLATLREQAITEGISHLVAKLASQLPLSA